jgi:hypothetical protein
MAIKTEKVMMLKCVLLDANICRHSHGKIIEKGSENFIQGVGIANR